MAGNGGRETKRRNPGDCRGAEKKGAGMKEQKTAVGVLRETARTGGEGGRGTDVQAFLALLPARVQAALTGAALDRRDFWGRALEVRLRVGRFCSVCLDGKNLVLPVMLTPAEGEDLLRRMCDGSVYAHRETLSAGFVTLRGGIRVGIAGTAVYENGAPAGLRAPTAFCVRIAHEVPEAADTAYEAFVRLAPTAGMLIFAPPGGGKTTLLRSLATRLACNGRRVVLLDASGEFSGLPFPRGAMLDILSGYRQADGLPRAVRTLSPEVLIADEIATAEESDAILSVAGCGVPLVASTHAATLAGALSRPAIRRLSESGIFGAYAGIRREGDSFLTEVTYAVGNPTGPVPAGRATSFCGVARAVADSGEKRPGEPAESAR